MPRPALSEEAVQQQRDRALQAALDLFTRQGVENVSVRAVASAVGLSPMALYRYFPGGKEELLATLRGSGFEALAAQLGQAVAGVVDPVDRLLRLVLAMVQYATQRPDLYRLMFDVTQSADGDEYLAQRRMRAWRQAADVFDEVLEAGLLQGERETLPHLFFAAIHGIIAFELSRQPDPRRRMSQLMGPMLEMLFRGSSASPEAIRKIHRLFPTSNPEPVTRRRPR